MSRTFITSYFRIDRSCIVTRAYLISILAIDTLTPILICPCRVSPGMLDVVTYVL